MIFVFRRWSSISIATAVSLVTSGVFAQITPQLPSPAVPPSQTGQNPQNDWPAPTASPNPQAMSGMPGFPSTGSPQNSSVGFPSNSSLRPGEMRPQQPAHNNFPPGNLSTRALSSSPLSSPARSIFYRTDKGTWRMKGAHDVQIYQKDPYWVLRVHWKDMTNDLRKRLIQHVVSKMQDEMQKLHMKVDKPIARFIVGDKAEDLGLFGTLSQQMAVTSSQLDLLMKEGIGDLKFSSREFKDPRMIEYMHKYSKDVRESTGYNFDLKRYFENHTNLVGAALPSVVFISMGLTFQVFENSRIHRFLLKLQGPASKYFLGENGQSFGLGIGAFFQPYVEYRIPLFPCSESEYEGNVYRKTQLVNLVDEKILNLIVAHKPEDPKLMAELKRARQELSEAETKFSGCLAKATQQGLKQTNFEFLRAPVFYVWPMMHKGTIVAPSEDVSLKGRISSILKRTTFRLGVGGVWNLDDPNNFQSVYPVIPGYAMHTRVPLTVKPKFDLDPLSLLPGGSSIDPGPRRPHLIGTAGVQFGRDGWLPHVFASASIGYGPVKGIGFEAEPFFVFQLKTFVEFVTAGMKLFVGDEQSNSGAPAPVH